ncbi:MAG: DUF1840 domain-containing protein [Candidatus Dechloromonas phosphoritropha]|nr:DUF1840 domain-containing protein [Candidatus Dechloromonas phosphoritropha]MBP8789106.1 DUF1840 domain-containing protein [Azonexus sp.]MBP9229458.1 DUF1840 domain-containing protein [Azonexus sp.]
MLINFKSPASGDVVMFEKNARELLLALGKQPDEAKGVITVAQLPGAVAALKLAMASTQPSNPQPPTTDDESEEQAEETVSLTQRALPLLDLLERSLQERVPVTWGV